MASLTDIQDIDNAEPLGEGYVALPPGDYQLYLESSDRTPTKTGRGETLACTFVVCHGEYEGKKLREWFNLWNENQDTVRIAKSQWAALCHAIIGAPPSTVRDSAQLHSRPFFAEVSNVPRHDDPTKRTNKLVFTKDSIRPVNSGPKAAPVVQTKVVPAPTTTEVKPATSGLAPWKRPVA